MSVLAFTEIRANFSADEFISTDRFTKRRNEYLKMLEIVFGIFTIVLAEVHVCQKPVDR
jgi:hypothetical protein